MPFNILELVTIVNARLSTKDINILASREEERYNQERMERQRAREFKKVELELKNKLVYMRKLCVIIYFTMNLC